MYHLSKTLKKQFKIMKNAVQLTSHLEYHLNHHQVLDVSTTPQMPLLQKTIRSFNFNLK